MFVVGETLKCKIGGQAGAFVCYGYDKEMNTGVVLVVSRGRKCLWPVHTVRTVA